MMIATYLSFHGGVVVFVLIVLLIVAGAFAFFRKPAVVVISRSLLIDASPEVLFPFINNSRNIQSWNSFVQGDPSVQLSFSGPSEGVGAQWTWDGKRAGAGQATIVESENNKRVGLRLDFKRPFKVTNFGEYVLTPQGEKTEVHWTINETAAIPRVLSSFVNLDKLIGAEFEKGLGLLKNLAEATAKK